MQLLLRRIFIQGCHQYHHHHPKPQCIVKIKNKPTSSATLPTNTATTQRRCVVTQPTKTSSPTTSKQTAEKISETSSLTTTTATAATAPKNNESILPLKLVTSPTLTKALPIIGHTSYIGLASGFLMTDMLQLRILLVGGYTGLVLFHMCHPKPLRIPLRWSAVFVLVNATAAAFLVSDRYGYTLTEEEEERYRQHFSKLTRGQYYQLCQMGQVFEYEDGDVLTVEGEFCPKLYFILSGKGCKVYHHEAFAANIEVGGFVNDVAFQQSHFDHTPPFYEGNDEKKNNSDDNDDIDGEQDQVGAYGTVVAMGKCTIMVWDQDTLRKHLKSRPDMERNMKYCLSEHLVKTLLWQREAAHLRQQQWNTEKDSNNNDGSQQQQQKQVEKEKTKGEKGNEEEEKSSTKNHVGNTMKPKRNGLSRRKTILRRSPSNDHIQWVEDNDNNNDDNVKNNHKQTKNGKVKEEEEGISTKINVGNAIKPKPNNKNRRRQSILRRSPSNDHIQWVENDDVDNSNAGDDETNNHHDSTPNANSTKHKLI